MSKRSALMAALEFVEQGRMVLTRPASIEPFDVIYAAARERLAQLPETCRTCGGGGSQKAPNHPGVSRGCPTCHGRGTVYPPALVERIAGVLMSIDDVTTDYLIEQYAYEIQTKYWARAVAVLDALNTETP